jgi:hypothetical protein
VFLKVPPARLVANKSKRQLAVPLGQLNYMTRAAVKLAALLQNLA